MRALLLAALVLFFTATAHAEDVFSDFLHSSQTRFSAADVQNFVTRYPQYMTNEMAMAFGIQCAKYEMDPDEIRSVLPADVHAGFDQGYSLAKQK